MLHQLVLVLLMASAQAAEEAAYSAEPIRCELSLEADGVRGLIWRDFHTGYPDELYFIALQDRALHEGTLVEWRVDNRPQSRRRRSPDYPHGRPEAEIFRQGPDAVDFGPIEVGTLSGERVWARLFGDNVHVGDHLILSSRDARRLSREGTRSVAVVLSHRYTTEIVARLAGAREWQAVLVTESGRELGRRTIRVPSAPVIQAGFERARDEMLRQRDAFVAGRSRGADATCRPIPPDDI